MHPGTSLECFAANVRKANMHVLIELVDQNGNVAFNESCQLSPSASDYT
jgi:hypothetical protein